MLPPSPAESDRSSAPPDFDPMVNVDDLVDSFDSLLGYPPLPPTGHDFSAPSQSVGARGSAASVSKTKTAGPKPAEAKPAGAPLPKRPKGRLFIGSVVLCAFLSVAYLMFNSLLRYSAHGEVVGRCIEVAGPWPGVVEAVYVSEGDAVRQGDPIARINSLELRQQLEQLDDSLQLERARVAAETALLRVETKDRQDQHALALSEFYDKWSELLWEQSRLTDYKTQLERARPLLEQGALTDQAVESLDLQYRGQVERVERLQQAVRILRDRTEQQSREDTLLSDRIRPMLVQIETLQSRRERLRQVLDAGDVIAPASGRIIRLCRFPGEYVEQSIPLVELLIEGSSEVVLYLPQDQLTDWQIGRQVEVMVTSRSSPLRCEVHRFAPRMQGRPEALAAKYGPEDTLMPVYLRGIDGRALPDDVLLGSRARLPRVSNFGVLEFLRQ